MQIYVKDIIETKTNKKLHLPGRGGKQSEDLRQSSFLKTASAWGVSAGGFFLHQTSFYTKLFYSGQELPKWNSLPLNTPLPSCLIAIHGQEYPLPRETVMFSRAKMFGKIKKHSFILFCLSTALLAICLKCQVNCQVSCQNYSGVVPSRPFSKFQQRFVLISSLMNFLTWVQSNKASWPTQASHMWSILTVQI